MSYIPLDTITEYRSCESGCSRPMHMWYSIYSRTSEQRTLWDRCLCPLFRGCSLFRGFL